MLKGGQRFTVTSEMVAIEPLENRMCAVIIPVGETVSLVRYPCASDDRMADVLWGKRPIVVFGRDLQLRANEIKATLAARAARRN